MNIKHLSFMNYPGSSICVFLGYPVFVFIKFVLHEYSFGSLCMYLCRDIFNIELGSDNQTSPCFVDLGSERQRVKRLGVYQKDEPISVR